MKSILSSSAIAAATTLLVAACGGGSGGGNSLPEIAAIADATINQDTSTGSIAFAVSDRETAAQALVLEVASSDTNLVPLENIVLGGSGSARNIELSPAPNETGSAVITVTVADEQGARALRSFRVTVNAVLVSFKGWTNDTYVRAEDDAPQTVDGFTFQRDADDDPAAFDALLQ